ncbi:MAG: threonylcarbamoyl-AMP synthase [Verrucomicrobiales bacterium]|nr:threonylcarbamoyl-AMP synthase [Verrucomicrobiales bacterium]
MNTAIVLPTHSPALLAQAVTSAAAALRQGEVVALPTETVYGLAANALDSHAVEQIFRIKGRPSTNPVIVHIADLAMISTCVRNWPPMAQALANAFWPGPMTLVLHKSDAIPNVVSAGGDTVGIRWPSHPVMQAVIRSCGLPLAAPSANPSNQLSPTNAQHVQRLLGNKLRLIVDGGQSQIGIESTVIDVTGPEARILRPGTIHERDIRSVVPLAGTVTTVVAAAVGQEGKIARSPGLLPKHYSPRATLRILAWESDAEIATLLRPALQQGQRIHVIAHRRIPLTLSLPQSQITVIPDDAEAYARALYAELHRCDEANADLIVVEAVRNTTEWRAVADRLQRGSAG